MLDNDVIAKAKASRYGPRKFMLDRIGKHIATVSENWIAVFEKNRQDDGFHIHMIVDGTAAHSALTAASRKVAGRGAIARN